MLFELKDSGLRLDGVGLIKEVKLKTDLPNKLARTNFKLIMRDETDEQIDLAISYTSPKISLSSVSVNIIGQELERNINFNLNLSKSIFGNSNAKFNVKGTIGRKVIDTPVYRIDDLLSLLKRVL